MHNSSDSAQLTLFDNLNAYREILLTPSRLLRDSYSDMEFWMLLNQCSTTMDAVVGGIK